MALGLLAIIAKANKPLNPPIEQCLVGGFFYSLPLFLSPQTTR